MSKIDRTGRSKKQPRHVRLYHWLMDCPAWHDLSGNARAIYIEMAKRYAGDGSNNGRLPYSVREAADELHIGIATAWRELKSLQDHGFISPVTRGAFSLKKRHATEWRLTDFPCDVTGEISTKDFMRWKPNTKIQNTVTPVKPTVSVVKPNGSCSGTHMAEKQPDGSCSGTVSSDFEDSRFHQKNTTSIPGISPASGSATATPEWHTPELIELTCSAPAAAPTIQVNDYDLALGMMADGAKFVSWRN
jgi:hypothetical protein